MSDHVSPRVLYVVRDAFGRDLAGFRDVPPTERVSFEDFQEGTAPRRDVVVAVHSGGEHRLRDEVDRICAQQGTPSVGVALTPTRIICGPVVLPGRTACYACYRRRVTQHAGSSRRYDMDEAVTGLPEGFGPQHLAVASGLVESALAEVTDGATGPGGTVRTFSLVSGTVSASVTVSVNRCPRCGDRFAKERSSGTVPVLETLRGGGHGR